jgi:hypothetical protein
MPFDLPGLRVLDGRVELVDQDVAGHERQGHGAVVGGLARADHHPQVVLALAVPTLTALSTHTGRQGHVREGGRNT